MERLKNLLRQTEFRILLFFVSLILFSWPIVNFSDLKRLDIMFVYLFLAWAAVILLLFLVGKSLDDQRSSEETENGRK